MKIKRFDQIHESDSYIEYKLEDSKKLLDNILNEWERRKKGDMFQEARMLGAIEAILTLNGKLSGGKPYEYESENFAQMMIRMANELINE